MAEVVSSPIRMTSEEAWERVPVGDTMGPLTLQVSWEEQEIRLDALDNHHPWYRKTSPFGGPIFFPIFLQALYYELRGSKYIWERSVAAKMEIQTLKPCRVDTRFHGTLTVVEKYERRGGHYLVTETSVTDEAGETVAKIRNTTLLNPSAMFRKKGES